MAARILQFHARRDVSAPLPFDPKAAEPVSPFRYLMQPHRLVPRQVSHRRRMLEAMKLGESRSNVVGDLDRSQRT